MNDRPFTLLDVMLGVYKHGLACKLSEESFTFLIGLILEHNDKGFKMPFDLNNQQAMGIGGGNTPKSVRRRRLTLSKFKIDGEPLLKFTSGNYGRSTCAKYEINYKKLLLYKGMWTGEMDLPAQIWGSSGHSRGRVEGTVGGTVPGPILRSEEDKEDNIRSADDNNFDDKFTDKESTVSNISDDITTLGKAVLYKWSHQLAAEPSDSCCRQALEAKGVDGDIDKLLEAIDRAPAMLKDQNGKKPNPIDALSFVVDIAQHPTWYAEQKTVTPGSLSYDRRDAFERKLKELEEQYAEWSEAGDEHFPVMSKADCLQDLDTEMDRIRGILAT